MRIMTSDEMREILQLIADGYYKTQRIHDQPEEVIDDLCGVIQLLAYRIKRLEAGAHSHPPEWYGR